MIRGACTPPLCLANMNFGSVKFALAHELLKNDEYLELVKSYVSDKKYVILDNGTDELGESIESGELAELAHEVNPTVLVLPDVLYDGEETIRRSEDFIEFYGSNESRKYMGVVQGKTYTEFLNCYAKLISIPEVSIVGIPYDIDFEVSPFLTKYASKYKYSREEIRGENRFYIISKLFDTGMVIKPLHLLGFNSLCELRRMNNLNQPFIQSHDAASAFSAGAAGIVWSDGNSGPKTWDHLSFDATIEDSTKNLGRITYNLVAYYIACGDIEAISNMVRQGGI